ncbi:MAG: exodeoxyribonuclease VII large subunit [Nitrosomonas sp.]|nr:exodeoxyribonuclease VII large subunit [Nitrosomonas sp.]
MSHHATVPFNVHTLLSVSELNSYARALLELSFPLLWIRGEVSNLKQYPSGHWYFLLKDNDAQVRCVMFRHKNQCLDWPLRDGMQIEAQALVTLYEARGEFQLTVEHIRQAGLGNLYEAFEKLKSKLQAAGIFDAIHKKNFPEFPKQIGIITSLNTAALHDILSTLRSRMPSLPIIIYPTPVQGKDAAKSIAIAIELAGRRAECDVLLLCRGGGSIEDLWAFNEEIVAYAIFHSKIPIVTGIGHETDFTIADFAADKRAPTPTGAAQIVSPDAREIAKHLNHLRHRMMRAYKQGIERRMQSLDLLCHRLIDPRESFKYQVKHLQHLREKLVLCWGRKIEKINSENRYLHQRFFRNIFNFHHIFNQQLEKASKLRKAMNYYLERHETKLVQYHTQLAHLNPQSVLQRGYSITFNAEGKILRDSQQVDLNESIQIVLADGWIKAKISDIGQ